jgi:hypothetical protein
VPRGDRPVRTLDGAGRRRDARGNRGRALTETFSVANFEKFQHYRDRAPPWIKLYNEILDDYAFAQLPDASKVHLILIWLLASRADNCLPFDSLWIAKRIGATEQVDLTRLLSGGFIEAHASGALASCLQLASPEREAEAETEGEAEKIVSDPPPADADAPVKPGRKTYPEDFEAFWRDYPIDALMSKMKTFEKWQRLTAADRALAHAAVPAFRAHCAKDPTYRPVHAERFLSQRRFDGFNEESRRGAAKPGAGDAARLAAEWGGNAARLVEAIGPAKFQAWFSGSRFEAGPPAVITVEKPFAADWIRGHYAGDLKRLFGEFRVEVKA